MGGSLHNRGCGSLDPSVCNPACTVFRRIPSVFSWLPIAHLKMQCTLPCLVRPRHYLQILVLRRVLLLTLREQAAALARWRKINEIYLQLPLFLPNASRIENCVQTLSQTVASETAKITSVEQIDSSLAARVAILESGAASASSGSGSARSWLHSRRVPWPRIFG